MQFFSSLKTKVKKLKCLNAVLVKNVFALLHHLMEGTYVPFVKNSYIDLVVFLMVMMLQSPTAIDAFLALVPMKELLFQPLRRTPVGQQLLNNLPLFLLRILILGSAIFKTW
jgi:hypothetical protein